MSGWRCIAIRLMKQLAIPLSNQKTVAKWLVIGRQKTSAKSLVKTRPTGQSQILDGEFFMRLLRAAFSWRDPLRSVPRRCRRRPRRHPAAMVAMFAVGADKRRVETARIPEVRLGATQAAVARLDREARAAIPFGRGAGVVGGRPLAAQFEQAPAVARAFIVEGFGELALIVERAAIAAVVDGLAVEGLWGGPVRPVRAVPRT